MDDARELRRAVVARYARLNPDGLPVFCTPSRDELAGRAARRQGPGTDGKPIYDSRDVAERAARELEALGCRPMRAYRCQRSPNRGHHHLATDNARFRPTTEEVTNR